MPVVELYETPGKSRYIVADGWTTEPRNAQGTGGGARLIIVRKPEDHVEKWEVLLRLDNWSAVYWAENVAEKDAEHIKKLLPGTRLRPDGKGIMAPPELTNG